MSEGRMAILMYLSKSIKEGRPFTLSSYNPGPPEDALDPVHDATIVDILRRRDEGLFQIFSGVSNDFIHQELVD